MPMYDYQCPSCKKVLADVFHKAKETPEFTCNDCSTKLVRLVGKANFTLKPGRGFYGTKAKV